MRNSTLRKNDPQTEYSNGFYCAAPLPACSQQNDIPAAGVNGEYGGCVFKVGGEMYFVPTQHVADDDILYIACDAQKIEGPLECWRSRLSLGDGAEREVEDAILGHLANPPEGKKSGEAFVMTSDGKTFRL